VAVGDALQQALRGARHEAAPGADALAPRLSLMVIGAGGALGSECERQSNAPALGCARALS
jgi:hypothetical protein